MANITTTQLDDSIPTIVAAEALGYLKANTVLLQLVRRDWENEVAQKGQTINIPFLGALSVNDKAVNTVVTLQTPGDTKVQLTLNKHKEVSFLIEDTARAFASHDALKGYMADSMKVLGEQIDSDIAALYSGFSQSVDATAGLIEQNVRESRRLLNAAKAPLIDRFLVLNEDADYEALGMEVIRNRDYQGDPAAIAVRDARLGRLYGFDIFMDQKIVTAGGEGKNLAFQRGAICFATRPLPPAPAGAGVAQTVMDEDGIGLRVTVSYSPNYLGVQVTVDVLYGVAELRDDHGVVVRTTDI